jgi:hypothetical protein
LLCRSQCRLGHLRSILVCRRQVAELQRTAVAARHAWCGHGAGVMDCRLHPFSR